MSLQLLNIYKSYKNGKQKQTVLKNLSIHFDTKGLVGIIGSSGSGKSTILNIIAGIEKPDAGEVRMNHCTLPFGTTMTVFRKQYISFIYQYYNMVAALTMKENILLSTSCKQNMYPKIEETLLMYAKKLEVDSLLSRYPSELSGGQLQRMALIRAFICDTPILLADEPTGALNQEHSEVVMKELQRYAKKHLVIVVSHDTKLLKKYTKTMIDLDKPIDTYDFRGKIKYEQCIPITSLYTNSIYKWKYVYKQLLYNKNKLGLIITSQIFTIVTTVMLITAYGGITRYLDQMYEHDPSKKYVEVQKNDYTKPIIKEEEYRLLKTKTVENTQYYLELSLGKVEVKEKESSTEYQILPKNKEHIVIKKGNLPKKTNDIVINEKFSKENKMDIEETLTYTLDNKKYTFLITGIIEDTLQSSPMIYIEEAMLDSEIKEKVQSNTQVIVEVEDPKSYIDTLDKKVFYSYSMHLDTKEGYQSLIELGSFVAIIFIIVSFGISMILIAIVLSTIMHERRKDSALLLVYGVKRIELFTLFIKENLCIACSISLLGSMVSYVVIAIVNHFHLFRFLTTIEPLFALPDSKIYSLIIGVYLGICMLLTVFSTTKIMKMNISQLLKEE